MVVAGSAIRLGLTKGHPMFRRKSKQQWPHATRTELEDALDVSTHYAGELLDDVCKLVTENEQLRESLRRTAHREVEARDKLVLATIENERITDTFDRVAQNADIVERHLREKIDELRGELERSRTRKRETEVRAARNLALALNYREGMRKAEGRIADPPTWIVKGHWHDDEGPIRVAQAD
jgi:hypothetical protein